MPQAFYILFGAGFTVLVSLAAGRLLLRSLPVTLYRQEEHPIAFVTGAACLSLAVFLLCAIGAARKGVFLAIGAAVLGAAFYRGAHRSTGKPLPPLPRLWVWILRAVAAVYGVLYFFNAMAPEMSPDGVTYHLGLVSRYLRAHGFERITTNMYANLSQGVEMLYLFAFSFGQHSAAALTHLAFLVALIAGMLCYARRIGFPVAGICGAILVLASPIVGLDASVAYNDVATACILFIVFYLSQIWAQDVSNSGLLVPLGLLAGFGYAVKYTAFLAVPYALAIVLWKSLRGAGPSVRRLLTVAACATVMIAPWMIKNSIILGNPVSPFLNRIFPNPYVNVSFEEDYVRQMRHYEDLKSDREIPIEVTMRGGALGGLLGPMFLVAPLALLSLRWPAGRQLLAAAVVFALPYAGNVGTRFLIPALPFLALAMGMAVAQSSVAGVALIAAHAILSWPAVVNAYCAPNAWRLPSKIYLRQGLRIESEESFLNFRLGNYGLTRMIEKLVPPGAKVFTFGGAAEAYTSREILVAYQSAFGNFIRDMLWTSLGPEMEPRGRLTFHYTARRLRQIRVVQTAAADPDQWSVGELRIFNGAVELPRVSNWKLRARPNPWGVQLAFDNSFVTRWRTWRAAEPGMFLSVEFGAPELSDSVVLFSSHDQYKVRLKLEGMDETGKWTTLAGAPEEADGPPMLGLRRAAIEEMKARGLDYMLIYDSDHGAEDFKTKSDLWGLRFLGERGGARLYHLE